MISDLQHVLNLGRCHRKIGAINSPHQRKNEEQVEVCLNCSIREKEANTYFAASHPDNKTMRPVPDRQTGNVSQSTTGTQTADPADLLKTIN